MTCTKPRPTRPRSPRWPLALWTCAMLVVALTVAGCGSDGDGGDRGGQASSSGTSASRTTYPLTVQNCGRSMTFDKAPRRVVTYYQTTLETLLALGLQDRIVGRSKLEEPALPDQAAAVASIDQLSDSFTAPTKEILLTARPDFVFARLPGREFDAAEGFATRKEIEAAGSDVYVMSAQCTPETVASLDLMLSDIETLGKIFDVQDRAAQLSDRLRSELAEIKASVGGEPAVKAIWYDSGEGPLYVYGKALGSDLIARAGGVNVFADADTSFPEVSVEEVAVAKPGVWITNNYKPGPTASQKAALLIKTFPDAPASKARRVVALKNVDGSPGIRNFAAVATLAKAFHPDAF